MIKKVVMPLLQHPTALVCVDGYYPFLESLRGSLFSSRLLHLFNNSDTALHWLKDHALPHPLEASATALLQPQTLPQALQALRRRANDPGRFGIVSTLTSGYLFRYSISGAQLFREAPEHLYKILYTGYPFTDDQIFSLLRGEAVSYYVDKTAGLEVFEKAVQEGQEIFFRQLAAPLEQVWVRCVQRCDSAVFEPRFAELVQATMQRLQAVEQFVWDATGSCIFVQEDGTAHGVCVRTPRQIEQMLQTPQGQKLPAQVRQSLHNGTHLSAHFTAHGVDSFNERGEAQLHPAHALEGNHPFLCCYVPNIKLFSDNRVNLQRCLATAGV
ncbi:MAG: hypothetical protein AAF320_03970 [Myxococcota bacterium]